MEALIETFNSIEIWEEWKSGGVLMGLLALLAVVIFFYALDLLADFRKINACKTNLTKRIPPNQGWIDLLKNKPGILGEIICYCQQGSTSIMQIQKRFREVTGKFFLRFKRRIVFLGVLVTTAPLMGLLGTVKGMLSIFQSLTQDSGKTIDKVASGIHEALITTQIGLMIAIIGYIFVYILFHKYQKLIALFSCLESQMIQHFYSENVNKK
jgi:biopolymer transport protein ExbB